MAAALGTPTRNALHLDRGGGIEVFFRRLFPAQMGNDYLVPVLVEDGQVLPHVAAYFRWKALEQGAPDQTLRTESYVLLDFLSWLRSRALRWVDARDTLIVAWTSEQTHLQQPRLVYKRDVVFGFYLLLQQIGYLAREHPEVGDLVGTHPNSAIRAEKVERVRRSRRKAFRSVVLELRPAFSPARSLARPRPGRRRTPTRAETEQLFDHLLGERDLSRCVRDWLWARFQAEGGLRAQGVAGLSLPTVAAQSG